MTPRVWTDPANWCGNVTSPGLSGSCAGAPTYPDDDTNSAHVAVFDSSCLNCTANISSAAEAYGIKMVTGYSGLITQSTGVGNTISVGAGGWFQQAGTFFGGNADISVATVGTKTFELSNSVCSRFAGH